MVVVADTITLPNKVVFFYFCKNEIESRTRLDVARNAPYFRSAKLELLSKMQIDLIDCLLLRAYNTSYR